MHLYDHDGKPISLERQPTVKQKTKSRRSARYQPRPSPKEDVEAVLRNWIRGAQLAPDGILILLFEEHPSLFRLTAFIEQEASPQSFGLTSEADARSIIKHYFTTAVELSAEEIAKGESAVSSEEFKLNVRAAYSVKLDPEPCDCIICTAMGRADKGAVH